MALNSIILYSNNNIKEIEENKSIPPPRISFSGLNKTISYIFYKKNKNIFYYKYNLNIDNIKKSKAKSFYSYFSTYKFYDNFFNDNLITKNEESRNKKNNINIKKNNASKIKKNNLNDLSEDKININKILNKRINNKRIFKKIKNNSKIINKKIIHKLNLENDIDKPKIKINESLTLRKINSERNIINNSTTNFYNNNSINNSILIKLKNIPYIRKKAINFKKIGNKKMSQSISLKSFSIHSEKSIKKEKFIKNDNNKKKILNICLFNKIKRNNNILYILRFLDYYDIINIFNTKNKKLLLLINKSIAKSYYNKIKQEFLKYNNLFELIKCNIIFSKIKEALKIDLIANIRIINKKENNILDPLYIKLSYAYNYFKKIKLDKELITKEDYEIQKNEKIEKICDYYSFDFYPKIFYEKNKNINNNIIYISKELPIQGKDCNNIATVQPILSFKEKDQGFLNFQIYNTEKGFIDFTQIKLGIKMYDLKAYLKHLNKKFINNIRISEYEELCSYWKNINLYEYKDLIIKMIKIYFGNLFEIKKIFFENIGIYIFKVHMKAIKYGEIKNKKNIGINIKIVEKNDIIKNEIRKNNLLFEKRDIVEIRVGDEIIYYFCLK